MDEGEAGAVIREVFEDELKNSHRGNRILHAVRPGAMPNVADLVAENAKLRGLVKALTGTDPTADDSFGTFCPYCDLDDDNGHHPACPWRQAAEYLAGLEAK